MHFHRLYDLVVAGSRPLPAPAASGTDVDLTLVEHPDRRLPAHPQNQYGYTYHRLNDGSTHVSWSDLFDFIVSNDGSRIDVHAETRWHHEPVYTYLLSQVVSVALLNKGVESYHGSAVAHAGRATVLLGNCGHGKSTLTAALVREGAKLITDDLVVLKQNAGKYFVSPGAFRLKLDRATADTLGVDWPSVPMNDGSGKHVFQVDDAQCAGFEVPLAQIIVLQPNGEVDEPLFEPLPLSEATRELLVATFNPLQADPPRLQRLLLQARTIAIAVPVLRLHAPRSLERITELVAAVQR